MELEHDAGSFQGKAYFEVECGSQEDVRGSVGRYYPYGEDRDSTANDVMTFSTYTRDSVSGLDYAQQRYHASGVGWSNRADPYDASAGSNDPGSWNRYTYVGGDPVGFRDPSGRATACNQLGQF